MASQSTYRYLQLDSTYRNRNQYPNPSEFVVPVNTTGNSQHPLQALDPISLAFPSETGAIQGATNNFTVQLSASSSAINNYYVGKYLEITAEYKQIINYDGATKTAIVETGYSILPVTGNLYTIRGQIPIISRDSLASGSTTNIISLGSVASDIDGTYVGQFVYFITGADQGIAMQISSYNGTTRQATLIKALGTAPSAGDLYDILGFTRENFYPLINPGTIVFGQPVCYSVELLSLIVPNVGLLSGQGGTFKGYPYLLLQLYNEGNMHTGQTLYSNNPNAHMALFSVPIGLNLNTESFFNLKDAKTIQTVKLVLSQPLHFKLTFPDGSPVILSQADNFSPLVPNPSLQFTSLFAFRRVDQQFEK